MIKELPWFHNSLFHLRESSEICGRNYPRDAVFSMCMPICFVPFLSPGLSEATQLSTLARLTYPVAFNTARHGVDVSYAALLPSVPSLPVILLFVET